MCEVGDWNRFGDRTRLVHISFSQTKHLESSEASGRA